ncbi:AAA domain-containing protein [Brevibacillus laterosporus]|uniref:AAA domain-containing protein n=1 Tax=Brevibacillus laterosporus TaxID=1465 RepID=UPI000E6D587A|nr:AAA domain-containing protein [Brevibacillus laterosporus]AYB40875.1 DUF2726 domain-containing protein [Brevibacillus laterosporus]MBM7106691.1 ATP-dependent RecD-like DNA helicase [Brevibacillus laterosporus]
MDEDKYLILVKNVDKTAQIQSYEIRDLVVWITYQSSSKEYPYALKDFVILQDPVITEITDEQQVYQNDIPFQNVNRIMDFETRVRIKFNDGKSCVCDSTMIRVESNSITTSTAKSILQYWTAISKHTGITEEEPDKDSYLKRQFCKLTFVSPNSVLDSYLNGYPVRVDSRIVQDTIFPFKCNLSQKKALNNVLRSQISIIEGPPGTGKTQTILNILANLAVMQNKKVAVVSSNNAAVQNVRDKLAIEGYHFLVATLGNSENKKKFFANMPYQDVSDWKSDIEELELLERLKGLNDRIDHLMKLERERAQLKQNLSSYMLEQEHFETYYAKQNVEQIRKLSFYRQTPEKILDFLIDSHIAMEKGKKNSILHKLKLIFRHGFTDFKRLKNQEIDVLLNFQQKYYKLKIEQLLQKIVGLDRELDQGTFKLLLKKHQQYSEKLFHHKIYQKYHERENIQVSEGTYKREFAKFIEQYPIILSTTHSLRNSVPENFLFDYVIVDESSQVDLLTGALALSCCKHAIIVGDTKQLPQIVDKTIEEKLGDVTTRVEGAYDYFRHNLLSSMLALYGDTLPKVILREHYRCHPKIIDFCNQKYYDGQLIAFTSEKEEDYPLLIYRTVAGNHMREVTHGKKGKFNQRELDVIEQEVLVDLAAAVSRHSDIGFTTPYRKQVDKASGQLSEEIECDTIHKYQGREKPIMILSTVLDSTRSGKMGLKFVNDPCLINVAVSRAQQRFILVTDHSSFPKYGNEIGDLIRYMEYSTVDDNILDSKIVSVFDLLYKDYSEKLQEFKERIVQHSKYTSENIMRTLIGDILQEPPYNGFEFRDQVLLKNLFLELDKLGSEDKRYVNNGASVDFVIYHKLDKSPILVIEVDGFAFHENNPLQLERDHLKNRIFDTFGLSLLRFSTIGSGEEQKIRMKLDEILQN